MGYIPIGQGIRVCSYIGAHKKFNFISHGSNPYTVEITSGYASRRTFSSFNRSNEGLGRIIIFLTLFTMKINP